MKIKYYLYLTVPLSILAYQPANSFSQQPTLFEERTDVLREFSNWQSHLKLPPILQKQQPMAFDYFESKPLKKPPVISNSSAKSFTVIAPPLAEEERTKAAPQTTAPALEKEEKLGWGQWFYQGIKHTVKSVLQRPFGERMQPSSLKRELASVERLSTQGGWASSKSTYADAFSENAPVFHQSTSSTSQRTIVSAPAHDMDESLKGTIDWVMNGGISVKEVIENVAQENPRDDFKVLIPVAQSNTYLGVFTRRHWTTLEVERKEGKYTATHYDSKGILSSVYSLEHIKKQLPANTQFSSVYTGQQGVFNDKDCGRFTISHIDQRLQNKEITKAPLSSITSIFSSIWRR